MNRSFIFFIITIFLLNFVFFAPIYFFNKYIINFDGPANLYLFLLPYLIVSFIFWIRKPIGMFKKPFVIFATFFLTALTGFAMMFLPMSLPGSKEHNYVMYHVCMPAIEKYYANKGKPLVEDLSDKNAKGEFRWWVQHSECEQNVYKGKGPIFSENPHGFKPK